MTLVDGKKGHGLAKAITIRVVGLDEYSHVRNLHARAMSSESADCLTEAEIAAFIAFVRSPAYSDLLRGESLYGAFIDGQLIGTASWHVNGDDGQVARISSVFVDPMFMRLGIGGQLLIEVEARAFQSGFNQLGISSTINAVPFFERRRLPDRLARREDTGARLRAARRLPAQDRSAHDANDPGESHRAAR